MAKERSETSCGSSSPTPRTSCARRSPPCAATPSCTAPAGWPTTPTSSRRWPGSARESRRMARARRGPAAARAARPGPAAAPRTASTSAALVDDAAERRPGGRAGAAVDGDVEPGVVVTGDEDRLRQVIGNLLDQRPRPHAGRRTPVEVALRRRRWRRRAARRRPRPGHRPRARRARLRPLLPRRPGPLARPRRLRPRPVDRRLDRPRPRRPAVARGDAGRRRHVRRAAAAHSKLTAGSPAGFSHTSIV